MLMQIFSQCHRYVEALRIGCWSLILVTAIAATQHALLQSHFFML